MNFFDNNPNFTNQTLIPGINNSIMLKQDINYKINELEQRIKRLEQRITILESNNSNNNYLEPDNSLYMI